MRLLLVEDDPESRQSLHKQLKKEGFAVDITDNSIDAEFLGEEEPYDAVILDLGLPQRSGLDVLKNWRQHNNPVPVIVLKKGSSLEIDKSAAPVLSYAFL
jgi:DNA-binding response OmpR family regulator